MEIRTATTLYEQWLATRVELMPEDLAHKHELMAEATFPFLRATFYRWAQQWSEACPELATAPVVLSIGDVHVENFGTWRDSEGRLAWGIDDVDEAYPLPWPQDLVRLATSAFAAIEADRLSTEPGDAAAAILEGYRAALAGGGRPFVLAEGNGWLRKVALGKLRAPDRFWAKLDALPTWDRPVPDDALDALRHHSPDPSLPWRIVHRVAGLGSLGRPRLAAVGDWRGGRVAREAKAIAPSAWAWATQQPEVLHGAQLLETAVRVPDPFAKVTARWTVRRLAPDCARVLLADLPHDRDERRLLAAMGAEVANVHLGTLGAQATIGADLAARTGRWLEKAAMRMLKLVVADWKSWRGMARAAPPR